MGGAAAVPGAPLRPDAGSRACLPPRRWGWRLWRRRLPARPAAALAVVAAVAGAVLPVVVDGAGGRVVPFPAGAFPAVGRLSRVCSLQCHTGPLSNGDTAYEAGGTRYPWGNHTCRSPPDPMRAVHLSPQDPDGSRGVDLLEKALAGRVRVLARELGAFRARQIVSDVQYDPRGPLRRGVCGGDGGLVREESVANVLTLLRNSVQGGVRRYVGKYDVIGYTRVSVGVCGTVNCSDVTAVDTTGDQGCGELCVEGIGCSCQGTTVLTTVGPDGEERSISLQQHRYLSLGRGLLAQTDWLGEHRDLWNLTGLLQFHAGWNHAEDGGYPQLRQPAMKQMIASLTGVPGTLIPLERFGSTAFSRLANTTTTWPQMLATVVCMHPIGSFVRDRSLCKGVPDSTTSYKEASIAGQRFFGRGDKQAMEWGWAKWSVLPSLRPGTLINSTAAIFQPSPFHSASAGPAVEPLAAYGLREVHSASPTERAIAATVRRRLLFLPTRRGTFDTTPEPFSRLTASRLHAGVDKDIERLLSGFDRSVFDVDEPPDPATVQDVVLAVLVILPEASALAVALVSTRTWRRRECIVVGMIFAVGLASLSAPISLAITERRAVAWRVSSVRTALGTRFPVGIDNGTLADMLFSLAGTELAFAETYLIAARTGYHPDLLLWLAVGFSAAYVVCAGASLAYIVRARRRDAAKRAQTAEASAWGADDRVPSAGVRGGRRGLRRWWRPRRRRSVGGGRGQADVAAAGLPADGPATLL